MKMTCMCLLTFAVAAAALPLGGCMVDESAPNHPRTANILTPDKKSSENAFDRETEKPQPDLPASGAEFPGHSMAARVDRVITADAGDATTTAPALGASSAPVSGEPAASAARNAPRFDKPAPANGSDTCIPETRYPDVNWYPGPIPALPEKPGGVMTGSTPVPGTGWSIDFSWGQVLPLHDYPHRNWHDTKTTYVAANVKHNPVLFFNIQNRLASPQNDATMAGNYLGALLEIPWFYVQTGALPLTAILECPFRQVTTQRLGGDPNYFGHLPATGAIMPSMTPGVIKWDYPFLTPNQNGQPPVYQPIAPTPGITLPPSATSEPGFSDSGAPATPGP